MVQGMHLHPRTKSKKTIKQWETIILKAFLIGLITNTSNKVLSEYLEKDMFIAVLHQEENYKEKNKSIVMNLSTL